MPIELARNRVVPEEFCVVSRVSFFGYRIRNGMNINIGRLDVIILIRDYKWDECQYYQIGCYYFVT